mmetsp:Transcript_36303/g.59023  ORF Transcript_36303/g.59023 Transcript_36303/m.59023 type:complete len:191 (-) Transcript_36303:1179-1751(-)
MCRLCRRQHGSGQWDQQPNNALFPDLKKHNRRHSTESRSHKRHGTSVAPHNTQAAFCGALPRAGASSFAGAPPGSEWCMKKGQRKAHFITTEPKTTAAGHSLRSVYGRLPSAVHQPLLVDGQLTCIHHEPPFDVGCSQTAACGTPINNRPPAVVQPETEYRVTTARPSGASRAQGGHQSQPPLKCFCAAV